MSDFNISLSLLGECDSCDDGMKKREKRHKESTAHQTADRSALPLWTHFVSRKCGRQTLQVLTIRCVVLWCTITLAHLVKLRFIPGQKSKGKTALKHVSQEKIKKMASTMTEKSCLANLLSSRNSHYWWNTQHNRKQLELRIITL